MAGNPITGDGLSSSLAGMSKNQLYDIMCQMKTLIEQNQEQARQILIQNPVLTKALFQAQIMLGMVQPPQVMSNIQTAASQSSQSPSSVTQQPSLPGQTGLQDQGRKPQQNQPGISVSTVASAPSSKLQPQALPSQPLQPVQQPKGHISTQPTPVPLPQPAQVPSITPIPHLPTSQPLAHLQPPMPSASTPLQQPMQTAGIQHLPLQPPLPPQPRPAMPGFPHQVHPQMGPTMGFQQSGPPQLHHSQPMYHSGAKPQVGLGPQFMQGQLPLPGHLPPQSIYQVGGSHLQAEFSQVGSSTQADRGSSWIPGLAESTSGTQLPGPPPFPGQLGASNQPGRAPPLTPEMEKALLQQVMSLTPEQINMLPPEQRNQVLQLQQMLRQ